MVIIYDFDGTLTPYSFPQYPILKQCGYTDTNLKERIRDEMSEKNIELCEAYYQCYREILMENEIIMSRENICLGAKDTKLNKGVEKYFERFQSAKTGIRHYIITSGIKDYVDETVIRKYVDGVYGVTFKQENGIFQEIDFLLTEKKKVDIIQEVRRKNAGTKEIIYFGDGLTDEFAFEYVHKIGGKSIFVLANEKAKYSYEKLNRKGIIDNCFTANFELNSPISKYIQKQIELQEMSR